MAAVPGGPGGVTPCPSPAAGDGGAFTAAPREPKARTASPGWGLRGGLKPPEAKAAAV